MTRRFLLKLSMFAIPIGAFIFFFETGLSGVVNAYNFKRGCLERWKDSIHTIVLGSSQAAYGIDPAFFSEPTFNLAMPSQSLFYDVSLVRNYAPQLTSLRRVIFTISYFSFDYEVIESRERWRDFYYLQFWGIKYPELQITDTRSFSRVALYGADTSLVYLIKGFKVDLSKGFSDQGYFRRDTAGADTRINEIAGLTRVRFHESQMNSKYFHQNVSRLKDIVSLLLREKIEVVFVTMPLYITYAKHLDRYIVRRNAQAIRDICDQFHIRYLDYSFDRRFSKKDFYDNDHLNFIGAEKISRVINDDILNQK